MRPGGGGWLQVDGRGDWSIRMLDRGMGWIENFTRLVGQESVARADRCLTLISANYFTS